MTIREAQDRMLARRFGIFNHFLFGNPSDNADDISKLAVNDWDERVGAFDAKALAKRLHETGAGYYFITVMQGSKHLLAPNSTFDEIAGTKPGDACPHRDLIADLIDELGRYDIDLFLYYTGDGPHLDPVCGPRFGFSNNSGPATMPFVEKWASVLREYAVRYGSAVKGWWIDGCYREYFSYTDELMEPYYEAVTAGNPASVFAMNDGVKPVFAKNFYKETMVCGEFNDFTELPESRFIDGAQAHILAPIGCGRSESEWSRWRSKGVRRDAAYMADYITKANNAGMPVTIDAYIDTVGNWDDEQFAMLKDMGARLG